MGYSRAEQQKNYTLEEKTKKSFFYIVLVFLDASEKLLFRALQWVAIYC